MNTFIVMPLKRIKPKLLKLKYYLLAASLLFNYRIIFIPLNAYVPHHGCYTCPTDHKQSGSGHLDTKAITSNDNNRFGCNEDVILNLFSSVVV